MGAWPEPVERVAAALRRSGVEAKIEELTTSVTTVAETAATLGVSATEIVETVIVLCDQRPVAVIVSADRRLSPEKVARATAASQALIASAAEVRDISGFDAGAVPPFPLPSRVSVYLDRSLLARRRIWVRAGSPRHLLVCAPGDLVALAGAEILDATEPYG